MNGLTYTRYELVRTFRNRRFVVFSLAFPLVLYFVIAGPNKGQHDYGASGISAPLYLMVGLASFGTMNAVLASGARIAVERQNGWNRQLRLTPLSTRAYFRTKLLTGYAMALCTILVLYAAGISLGVSLPASDWLRMTGLILIALLPFAGLGVMIGHLVSADSVGPVIGGTTALLALLGGTWFPITGGALRTIAEGLPSYWLVQAGHVSLGGQGWPGKGWLVVGAWALGAALLAARAYRRDTQRA
jgi:ABC-2 type transport system permease protein